MTTDTLADDLADDLADLVSAEDFLDYFDVAYERHVVQVNRLHILQRFHDYLGKLGSSSLPTHAEYRDSLAAAYNDFVHHNKRAPSSDELLTLLGDLRLRTFDLHQEGANHDY